MFFEQKKKEDVQVAFISSRRTHRSTKRPSSAPALRLNSTSAAFRKQHINRIAKADSFFSGRKSITEAKNKKDILAIIAPALQAANSHDVPELPKSRLPIRKWTLREIAGYKDPPEFENGQMLSSRTSATSPRPPLYFLKDRIRFESPGLSNIFDAQKACGDSQPKRSDALVPEATKEGFRPQRIPSSNETAIGPDPLNQEDSLDDHSHEPFLEFNNQFRAVKKELALNTELMLSLESELQSDSSRVDFPCSSSDAKFAALRKINNLDPELDPQDRAERQQLVRLRTDVTKLVEDVRGDIEDIKKNVNHVNQTRPDSIKEAFNPVRQLVSFTGLLRRALKTLGKESIELGWIFEECWRGMGFVFEGTLYLEHILNKRQSLDIETNRLVSQRFSTGHASAAIYKLQESFDIDIYKRLVDGLQNELHEIKKENISLRGRVKANELLTRQRLISHLYNDDSEDSPEDPNAGDVISTQRGEALFLSVHVPNAGVSSHPEKELRKSRRRSSAALDSMLGSISKPSAKNAITSQHDKCPSEERRLLSAQAVGLEKLSLPSTTLPAAGLDLVLGRIPQVITHAINAYQLQQNVPPHLTPNQLHQLCLDVLLDIRQDYNQENTIAKSPQLPDLLQVYFQVRFGTKSKADEEMGRLCSSLQEVQQKDTKLSDRGTFPLISHMGKFLGLSKNNLTCHALRIILYGLKFWYANKAVQKIHFEAQSDLFETRNRGLMNKADPQDEILTPRCLDFFDPDLLIPLAIAEDAVRKVHLHFHFRSTIEIVESYLEAEVVLADGSSVTQQEMQVLLTLYHIHEGIKSKLKVKFLKADDIAGLFRRADPRRCGRMPMLQFISCIRSLRCGITDDEIMTVVRLFDTSTQNLEEVDYKKFAIFFSPVTLFVTVHTMISSLIAMWSYETALNESEAMRKFVCNDFKQRVTELSEFTAIMQSMRNDITVRQAATYFQECLDISGTNYVTRDTFLVMSRVHNLFNNRSD